jgi:DNA (cytosine-5)-methyltransferase 1
VGVDIKPQKNYPFEFHQADAMTYPLERFDVIHASPPCQAFTSMRTMPNAKCHTDLLAPTRERLKINGRPYVIENVPGEPINGTFMLCGTMFNLGVGDAELRRHRYFETSFPLASLINPCQHLHRYRRVIGVYGGHGRDLRRIRPFTVGVYGNAGGKSVRDGTQQFSTAERAEAMGINWMSGMELSQAIPPAYTEWIGKQLMDYLGRANPRWEQREVRV